MNVLDNEIDWTLCYEMLDRAATEMVVEKQILVHKTSISELMAYVLEKEREQQDLIKDE